MTALGPLSAEASRSRAPIWPRFWSAGSQRPEAEQALGRPFDYRILDQLAVLIDAANRSTPVLDPRRYSRFGRELPRLLDRALRELAARPPAPAASAS